MSWWALAGIVALALLVLMAPGYLVARSCTMSRRWSFLAAPTLGLGTLGIATTGLGVLGVPWGWPAYAVMLVVLALLWGLSVRFAGTREHREPKVDIGRQAFWFSVAGVALAAVVGSLALIRVLPSPDALPMFGDASFHLFGTKLVSDSGNTNPTSALTFLYDRPASEGVYYPVLWHALTSLLTPLGGILPATNTMVFAVAFVVWPMSIALLTVALFPNAPVSAFFSNIFGLAFVMFPAVLLVGFGIYPFGLGISVLPAVIAIGLWALAARDWRTWLLFAIGVLGTLFAQPSVALLLVIPAFAVFVVYAARTSVEAWRKGHGVRVVLLWLLGVAALVGVVVLLLQVPYVQILGRFERPSDSYRGALASLVNGSAFLTFPRSEWVVLLVIAAAGALVSLRSFNGKVLVLTAVLFTLLSIAAAGPDNWARVLTGPWYKDFQRLAVPVLITLGVFAGGAVGTLAQWIANRFPARAALTLGLSVVVVLAAMLLVNERMDSLIPRLKESYYSLAYVSAPERVEISPEQLEPVYELEGVIPDDDFVLSVPSSTMSHLYLGDDARPYFRIHKPQSNDQKYLAANFDEIATDPLVCEIINNNNAYYYLDYGPDVSEMDPTNEYPGFSDVDTDQGFEMITQGSGWKLFKITACG